MASLMEKAAKGSRAAILRLYEQTKKEAYFVATQLVRDSGAVFALVEAYREVLALSSLRTLPNEEAFRTAIITAVVHQSKKQIVQRNPKAFRLPTDRRFDIRSAPEARDDDISTVFAAFTDLQRLIFVLDAATDLDEASMTAITKLDRRTLAEAIGVQQQNIDFVLGEGSCAAFIDKFKARQTNAKLPVFIDDGIECLVGEIVAPVEKARKKRTLTAVLITLGICVLLAGFSALLIWDMTRPDTPPQSNGDTTTTTNAAQASVGTVTSVTATHYADIDIKDYGTVTVALDTTIAPETVTNFAMLAKSGFYDGLTFHRIMKGFMMQGGDPNGNGSGGSDKNVTGEFAENGIENPLSHVRGAISMARATDYNSGSSQFFIVHEDSTFLDGQYAAFGYVTEGMDIVDAICDAAAPIDDNGTIPAEQQPIINTITIREAE